MSTQDAAKKIVQFVVENGPGISFVEIMRHLGSESRGDETLALMPQNIVLWQGLSKSVAEAFNSDLVRDALEMRPTSALVYIVDGVVPNLPLAKAPPRSGYKLPHWLPCVFSKRTTPRP